MKASGLICLGLALLALPLFGDTIYQTNAQGKEIILQRDAIVVHQDADYIDYKHFDLRERRVTVVRLNRGSLPIRVEVDARARPQIVEAWKRFGYKATVTDQAGKISHVFDLYIDFYPPGGRGSLLESIAPRTTVPLQIDNGGADEFSFEKIDHVEIQGSHLGITLREGKTITGKFLMPTTRPAEARLQGITDKYDPASPQVFDFSVPLAQVRLVSLE
jgi:hypothetical protein